MLLPSDDDDVLRARAGSKPLLLPLVSACKGNALLFFARLTSCGCKQGFSVRS